MKNIITKEEATIRLETLCATSEQCSFDILNKLTRWKVRHYYPEIIEHLKAMAFVDDARFARSFVRDKYRFSGWGRRKIVAALYQKRIAPDDIKAALAEIDRKEYAAKALGAMKAKARSLGENNRETRDKLIRFASQRGYEPALIFKILEMPSLWGEEE